MAYELGLVLLGVIPNVRGPLRPFAFCFWRPSYTVLLYGSSETSRLPWLASGAERAQSWEMHNLPTSRRGAQQCINAQLWYNGYMWLCVMQCVQMLTRSSLAPPPVYTITYSCAMPMGDCHARIAREVLDLG